MKTKVKTKRIAAIIAALTVASMGTCWAQEADTNATTVAYWKFGGAADIALSPTGVGISDLATNAGQGIAEPGTGAAPAAVQDLWFEGVLASELDFTNIVPPASMFNGGGYFSAGPGSWDCGANQFPAAMGSLLCDNSTYGFAFDGPSFTFEMFFKSDTTNDAVVGTELQTLIFDHWGSTYCFLYLNDGASDTNNIGSLRFEGWNEAEFPD